MAEVFVIENDDWRMAERYGKAVRALGQIRRDFGEETLFKVLRRKEEDSRYFYDEDENG